MQVRIFLWYFNFNESVEKYLNFQNTFMNKNPLGIIETR